MTGWGLADLIHVSARTPDDDVIWLLVDTSSEGLQATRLQLLAVNASVTVELRFANVRVNAAQRNQPVPLGGVA